MGCSRYCSTKIQPKRKAPRKARRGFHSAKIVRAMTIQPRPPVSPSVQDLLYTRDRWAPAIPARAPPNTTQR
ncbi:hypothetical protein ES707_09020 [subsurface metagenome]